MRELNVDIAARKPKRLLVEMQLHADWAVTMGCGDACPYVPTTVEDWDIPDPAGRPLEEVRAIRDTVAGHVRELVEHRLDAIRNDHTAHQLRLERLLPELVAEFEGRHSAWEIRACADAIVTQYDDAPIRTHVLTLAQRQTRECLKADTCDVLAVTR
jgi:hypothetical protein